MNFEWIAFGSVLAVAAWLLVRGRRPARALRVLALVAGAAAIGAAIAWQRAASQKLARRERLVNAAPRQGGPDGYVSSDQCRACHPSQYDSWHRTFHRTMTQLATPGAVLGDFNRVQLDLLGKRYALERQGDEFWVEMDDPNWHPSPSAPGAQRPPRVRRRITLLTGSHSMQVYWLPAERGNLQSVFPFAWLIADRRWAPFHNTFLRDPEIAPVNQSWNLNCINCHATAGQPRPSGQTASFDTRTGELGIACEACHGPGEEHAALQRNFGRRYLQHFFGKADSTIVNPAKLPARISAQACGQCHGIKWIPDRADHLKNGARFRPGRELADTEPLVRPTRLADQPWLAAPLQKNPTFLQDHYWSDGMVRVSGREYSGMIESPCHQRGELSCVSCHSLHNSSPDDQLARKMDGNEACVQCHRAVATRLTEHTHHSAGSSGSLCYNCHMPHTTYGLLKAIRSHQIDSPSVRATLATGRPNACNLCHLDQTLEWTGTHLARWFKQPAEKLGEDQQAISAAVLWATKGDAGQRALMAWAMGWEEARKASGEDWMAPYLSELMNDPYSAVRYIAHRSLKSLGHGYEKIAYDFVEPGPNRSAAKEKVMELWAARQKERPPMSRASLLLSNGGLQQDKLERIRKERNDMSMDLQE